MPAIRPFAGYFVNPELAHEVVSPAYDSMTPNERHAFATENPRSFLNVMRSPEEFPEGARPDLAALLGENSIRLRRMLDEATFEPETKPCLYLYRMKAGGHVQTGVIAEISIAEYDTGRLKRHENTQCEREERLVQYLESVGASSSPVCLAYRGWRALDALVEACCAAPAALELTSDDGVVHTIWRVEDEAVIGELSRHFSSVEYTYLTDGHHRTQAASAYAARRRSADPGHTGKESYNHLLVALFPHDQLEIHPYNRCVRSLNGYELPEFLSEVEKSFEVTRLPCEDGEDPNPAKRGELAMWVEGQWFKLRVRPEVVPADDPVRALDVMILQEQLLAPALGVHDPRTDPRIGYVPGSRDVRDLETFCNGEWQLAFAAYPASMEDLFTIANADQIMPPKSTWFSPKVRSGIFLCFK